MNESTQKMLETRRRLGRRLPRSEPAPFRLVASPRVPRATGAATAAIQGANGPAGRPQ